MISIIVPMYNEEANVVPLCEKLTAFMDSHGEEAEAIIVNDGSTDGTLALLRSRSEQDRRIKIISFRRNFGQTAAMMAGFDYARGDVVLPMDGDLQNDPEDIPLLLKKLAEGYDVVSGWRVDRKDSPLTRTFPSMLANRLISWISGVRLHDYGCTLKAYRREILAGVKLYGEMHRLIPIFASWRGGRVTEIPVSHHPRIHGNSKYGIGRIYKVILDLCVVQFLDRYLTKPIYVFGVLGFVCLSLSFLAGAFAVFLKLFHGVSFILTPLPLLTVIMFLAGLISILMGLQTELLVRTYFESQEKAIYLVKETVNIDEKR